MEKSIYNLAFHETIRIDCEHNQTHYVTRVPGGWIYNTSGSSVFIPYHKEYEYTNK